MDNSDKYRSTDNIPIRVTVTSELEPTRGEGTYTATVDGFILDFSCGDDKYTVSHTPDKTVVSSDGLLKYTITLCNEETRTELVTVLGSLAYNVRTLSCSATQTASGVALDLAFMLIANGEEDIMRRISVVADFISERKGN